MWRHGSMRVNAFHRCKQQVVLVISEQTGGPRLLSDVYASIE